MITCHNHVIKLNLSLRVIFILINIPKVLSSRSFRRLGGSKWFNAKIRYDLAQQMAFGFFYSSFVFSDFSPSLNGVNHRLQIFHSSFVLAAFNPSLDGVDCRLHIFHLSFVLVLVFRPSFVSLTDSYKNGFILIETIK